ncbi:MAG: glucuronate isomerase [Saprospiraceae bacterium]
MSKPLPIDSYSPGSFLTEDFMLQSDEAKRLYHDYAKSMPIIDYHCHLPPKEIADNQIFNNLTEIWLRGDHYKWRAMRALGVDEAYITGNASDKEKFLKWASIVPQVMRNPLYHWTHMELKNPFGFNQVLSLKNAEEVYERANDKLKTLSTNTLLNHFNVARVGTTDDPVDSLEYHKKIADSNSNFKVVPTFRPDPVLNIEDQESFNTYIDKLESASGKNIESLDQLYAALKNRHDAFSAHGCKASDHGQVHIFAADYTESEVRSLFAKARLGITVSAEEGLKFKSAVQYQLALMDHEKGWVQQFHLGAIRDNNMRLLNSLGKNTGFDSIGDYQQIEVMSKFFNRLDSDNRLAKTIIYNVNPSDNAAFATMAGNYQDGTIRGKMQWGSGWWYLDQKDGMEEQMNILSNMGVLSCFVGMITDSRSFLSFPRHEYFRRILCNLFGNDIVNGELPGDIPWIGKMIQDICYNNAKEYFGF